MDASRPAPFIGTERISLRALVESDVCGPYVAWLNDAEVCAGNSHHVYPYSPAKAAAYIKAVDADPDELVLAIIMNAESRHIGNIALSRIHRLYRSAQLSILLGDRDSWGQGYGAEAARLLVHHGFTAMNLARIECGTFASNTAMRKLALGLGMQQEGVRRQAAWKDGRYVDIVEFGILRDEFLAANP